MHTQPKPPWFAPSAQSLANDYQLPVYIVTRTDDLGSFDAILPNVLWGFMPQRVMSALANSLPTFSGMPSVEWPAAAANIAFCCRRETLGMGQRYAPTPQYALLMRPFWERFALGGPPPRLLLRMRPECQTHARSWL